MDQLIEDETETIIDLRDDIPAEVPVPQEYPLGAVRGFMFGAIFSAPFWIAVGYTIYRLFVK